MTLRPYLGRIGLLALAALLVGLSAVFGVGLLTDRPAEAAVERIYTLPFYSNYRISCGFGCYSGHAGVDYELGLYGEPGEVIAAAAL
jgi:hypothetical protein